MRNLPNLRTAGILILFLSYFPSAAFFQPPGQALKLWNDSASFYFESGLHKKAKVLLDKAVSISPATVEQATSYLLLGDWEEYQGYSEKALQAYRKSRSLAQRFDIAETESAALSGISSLLSAMGRYDSVEYYLDASQKLSTLPINKIRNMLVAGRYWQSQNQFDKSLASYQKAYDESKTLGYKRGMILALSGMGSTYFTHDETMVSSRKVIREALRLCDSVKHADIIARNYARLANTCMVLSRLDSAESFLHRAKAIVDITGNLSVRGYVLSSLSILMTDRGDLAGALAYAWEPLRIKRELMQIQQLQNDLLNIAELQMSLKQYNPARKTIEEGIATSRQLKDVMFLNYFYRRSAELDSMTGDYKKAFVDLRKSLYYKDSVFSLQKARAMEEISKKYEAEQKEKIIAEKELVIQKQKYQQSVIIGSSAFALLILAIFIFINRNKLQEERMKRNKMRLQTIVHTQEEVQQSIARDIHDGLVQVMGAAKLALQSVNTETDRAIVHQRIKEASAIIDDACAEARSISHQLLPYSLMKDGLIASLEELFSRSLAKFKFTKSGEIGKLKDDIVVNIYRIVQEIVNNIVKHSEADHVETYVEVHDQRINLVIEDNGKGFQTSGSKNAGVGMTNMQTRAELINGSLLINSQPGKGTFIQLSVPL